MNNQDTGTVNVFLSHNSNDERLVTAIKQHLCACGNGRMNLVASSDLQKNAAGTDQVEAALEKSNWFFLILTAPSANWDWCLFETGMFRGWMGNDDRMVCLYAPNVEPPEGISGLKLIKAVPENVKTFLRDFYCNPPLPDSPPLNRLLGDDHEKLASMAASICQAIAASAPKP